MAEKIYIVEDEPKIREELSRLLEKYGYTCQSTEDFTHITQTVLAAQPQLILLDLNLPRFDGFSVCRELRSRCDTPIIIVTSRDSELDELMSLNLGADDFITKPYNTQILLAHIASVLKRAYHATGASCVAYAGLSLDMSRSVATFGSAEVELSKNERQILHLLLRNPGTVVPREELMNELWQSDEFVDDNTLTVNVNRLRKKLESIGLRGFLKTRRGQGYLL